MDVKLVNMSGQYVRSICLSTLCLSCHAMLTRVFKLYHNMFLKCRHPQLEVKYKVLRVQDKLCCAWNEVAYICHMLACRT